LPVKAWQEPAASSDQSKNSEDYEADSEPEDSTKIRVELPPGELPTCGKEQWRKEDKKDEIRF
jgi:hypothetical protein